jgi:hypothetical protein
MKSKFISAALLSISLFAGVAWGQKKGEIRTIDRYVKQLTSYVETPSATLEIYADVSKTTKPRWRKFRSEKSLEGFRKSNDVYEIAYVWRKNGRVVVVNFTFTSGSGDWAHYVFHRFRGDGSLAKVEAELRTFYGRMSVVRTYYYRRNGELITKRTKYSDMATGKPKKPGDDFYDNKVRIYKTTKRLPFLL